VCLKWVYSPIDTRPTQTYNDARKLKLTCWGAREITLKGASVPSFGMEEKENVARAGNGLA
jgi:hypothetical protein